MAFRNSNLGRLFSATALAIALTAAAGSLTGCGQEENKVILPENPTAPPTAAEREAYNNSGSTGASQAPTAPQQKQR